MELILKFRGCLADFIIKSCLFLFPVIFLGFFEFELLRLLSLALLLSEAFFADQIQLFFVFGHFIGVCFLFFYCFV